MKDDLISIIIPVYNCEKYIDQAIETVKLQSYTNWELLIVNDGSKDNSLNVIQKETIDFREKVKIINFDENQGVAKARNEALKIASGRYIAYLDADDWWEREKLDKQLNFMKENNLTFSYTSYSRIKEDGTFLRTVKASKLTQYKDLLKNAIMLTSTIMIDLSKVEKSLLFMPNLTISEDTQTWLNILKTGVIAYGLDENLAKYRQRKGSASSNKIKSTIGIWKVYKNYQLMGIFKSSYYTFLHAVNAIKKRVVVFKKMQEIYRTYFRKVKNWHNVIEKKRPKRQKNSMRKIKVKVADILAIFAFFCYNVEGKK